MAQKTFLEVAYSKGITDRVAGKPFAGALPQGVTEGQARHYRAAYRAGFMRADSEMKRPMRQRGSMVGADAPMFTMSRALLMSMPQQNAAPPLPPPAPPSIGAKITEHWGLALLGTAVVIGGGVGLAVALKKPEPATKKRAA